MKWHVFVGRRRMDVGVWLGVTGIRSHQQLEEWCEANNVEAPSKDAMKGAFGIRRKPKPAPVEAKKAPRKPPKKKVDDQPAG